MGTSLSWKTDSQLHDAVRRQLDEDPEVRAHDIAVTASDGVVTLTGCVDSYAEKLSAEQSVTRVRGVRGVANDIDVNVRDERTDPEIAKDAVHALQSHTNVPNRVTVTVRSGLVTLDGTVDWMYQKAAAESAVKYLKGVRSVSNLIRISQAAPADEVKTRIEDGPNLVVKPRGSKAAAPDGHSIILGAQIFPAQHSPIVGCGPLP
jgi:osmotically-inducible protein OsmY